MLRDFETMVLGFLSLQIVEVYEGNSETEVTINLKDVNYQIGDMSWDQAMKEYFAEMGYNLRFSYGYGDWVTVHKD